MNIYVGNLDYEVDEEDLKEIFEDYGPVESVKLIKDRETGKSKGFAFVTFVNGTDGQKAISDLSGAKLEDRKLIINEAKPKKIYNN